MNYTRLKKASAHIIYWIEMKNVSVGSCGKYVTAGKVVLK
jgi:hypothetical protein